VDGKPRSEIAEGIGKPFDSLFARLRDEIFLENDPKTAKGRASTNQSLIFDERRIVDRLSASSYPYRYVLSNFSFHGKRRREKARTARSGSELRTRVFVTMLRATSATSKYNIEIGSFPSKRMETRPIWTRVCRGQRTTEVGSKLGSNSIERS